MDEGRKRKIERWVLVVLRSVVGIVFLWSSLSKLSDPAAFAYSVANYRLLPEWGVGLFAVCISWLEFCCAVLLLAGQWVRVSSLVVSGLLVVFMTAVGISIARGLDLHCGCFSSSSGRKIGFRLLGEDALYLVMSLFLMFRARDAIGWKAFLGLCPDQGKQQS